MRYLDPKTSRWLSTDPALAEYIPGAPVNEEVKKRNGNLPGLGGIYNTINLHLYHYAGNNPIKYTDPDGRVLETAFDIASMVMGAASFVENVQTGNVGGAVLDAVGIVVDVAAIALPCVPGGAGIAIKALSKADKVDNIVDAIKGGERIFGTYKDLQKVTKGYNNAIQAHHLVPKTLANLLNVKPKDMASVVLDKATHAGFTKDWNKVLDAIRTAPDGDVKNAILKEVRKIYKDHPDLLKATEEWLKGL